MSTLSEPLSGDWTDELVVPGPEGARYDATADGAHVIALEDAHNGLVRVGWDGRTSEPFELMPQRSGEPFVWSPAGLHVAWYGTRGSGYFVAVDGVEYPAEASRDPCRRHSAMPADTSHSACTSTGRRA